MPSGDLKLIVSANTKQAEAYLRNAANHVGGRNTQSLLDKIGLLLVKSIRGNFRDQTAPDGVAWAPLKSKRRRGSIARAKVLIDTGRLMGSIVHEADEKRLQVGTNTFYAPFHQFGTRRGIPARPFVGIKSSDLPKIVRAADSWVRRQLNFTGSGA